MTPSANDQPSLHLLPRDPLTRELAEFHLELAAHDLRRTYAKLARKGGADLEQIQLNIGHASLTTTERYLGAALDLDASPCDVLGLG